MARDMYTSGEYLARHPLWGAQASPWKATQVRKMLQRHSLAPKTVCEVGCGAGEILKQLHDALPPDVRFVGYDISPQAIEICRTKESERLQFVCGDFLDENRAHYDLILLMDVIEHVEDYLGFLRRIRGQAQHTMLHIPLDLSVQSILRNTPMKARRLVGHLQYFTRDTALATLHETGYEIVDLVYTGGGVDLPQSRLAVLARIPRRLLFAIHQDLAVRLLGGYSLLVLAK